MPVKESTARIDAADTAFAAPRLPSGGAEVVRERLLASADANAWWSDALALAGSAAIDLPVADAARSGEQGILLVGGSGARLRPVTDGVNKHLLALGQQPVFFYPLTNLIRAGVTDLAVSTSARDLPVFQSILGSGAALGISIRYHTQEGPRGVATAIGSCAACLADRPFVVALGDTVFSGQPFVRYAAEFGADRGALLASASSSSPERFESVEFADNGRPAELHEKARVAPSDTVVGGFYVFDPRAIRFAQDAPESPRGEFDVNAINRSFLHRGELALAPIPDGSEYLDVGTFDSMERAHAVITAQSAREQLRLYSPHWAAMSRGLITRSALLELCRDQAPLSSYFSELGAALS